MAWAPAYNVYGGEPLIRQLLAIVNRDIQAALDFVSGDPGSLRPFASYQLAESPTENYPAILVLQSNPKVDPETAPGAAQTVPVICALAVAHQNPNQVAIQVQRYAMAVWHVLTASWVKTPGDWALAGLPLPESAYGPGQVTTGLAQGKLNRVFVEPPGYGELRQTPKSIFVKAASMSIECDLFES